MLKRRLEAHTSSFTLVLEIIIPLFAKLLKDAPNGIVINESDSLAIAMRMKRHLMVTRK